MDISNKIRSQILIDALPHIQKYHDKIVVVKYGGNAMTNAELKEAVMSDIVLLSEVGLDGNTELHPHGLELGMQFLEVFWPGLC